jgi:predicted transcriptional regulator
MTTMTLSDELVSELEAIARQENRTPEEVLKAMLAQYRAASATNPESVREVRLRAYARARRYWQSVGDQERLALTDAQLDEQFWFFDQDGIPRLKSDEGKLEILPSPWTGLDGLLDSETDASDLSESVRDTLAHQTDSRFGWTTHGRTD